MACQIYNTEDLIDSRDVIARTNELQDEVTTKQDEIEEFENDLLLLERDDQEERDDLESQIDALQDEIEDIKEELDPLVALTEEAETYSSEWTWGTSLIRDSYFEEYAKDLAEGVGAISSETSWPCDHIDWEAAADTLKMDYTSIDFDGVEYWVHS